MVFLKLMNENTINFIFNEIEKAQKILIISHVNPDGDTLGTMCALKLFIGKKADTLVQTSAATGIPETYKFLPEINLSKNLDNVQNIYDLVIAVDVASIDRIVQNARQIFDNAKMTINIDHHKTNNGYAKLNYVIGSASSAGEVLYNIFKEKNIEITKDMADCLYVSILTDTGGFRYENTKPETLEIAAKLIKLGVDNADITKKCYNKKAKNMVLFQASIVSKAKFLLNNTVAIALIEESDFKKFGANNEYTEGIAETLRTIKTVEVSAVLKESDNQTTKVSLRSDNIDVCEIVKKFNGGGHIHAAGCTIKKPLKIAYELLVDEIEKCLNS